MAEDDFQIQMVTFQLGIEKYGIDIMDVQEIVSKQEIRTIPNAPAYVEGIFNLRGYIIPVINLHKRFQIEKAQLDEDEELLSGFIIVNINNMKLGVIIDKVMKVVYIKSGEIHPPPKLISGIGAEYIHGVVNSENDEYLVLLDIHKLFDPEELKRLESIA